MLAFLYKQNKCQTLESLNKDNIMYNMTESAETFFYDQDMQERAKTPAFLLEDIDKLPSTHVKWVEACNNPEIFTFSCSIAQGVILEIIKVLDELTLQKTFIGTRFESVLIQAYYATAQITMVATKTGKIEFGHAYWKLGRVAVNPIVSDTTDQHISNVHTALGDDHVAAVSAEDYQLMCSALRPQLKTLVQNASAQSFQKLMAELVEHQDPDIQSYAKDVLAREEMRDYLLPAEFLYTPESLKKQNIPVAESATVLAIKESATESVVTRRAGSYGEFFPSSQNSDQSRVLSEAKQQLISRIRDACPKQSEAGKNVALLGSHTAGFDTMVIVYVFGQDQQFTVELRSADYNLVFKSENDSFVILSKPDLDKQVAESDEIFNKILDLINLNELLIPQPTFAYHKR